MSTGNSDSDQNAFDTLAAGFPSFLVGNSVVTGHHELRRSDAGIAGQVHVDAKSRAVNRCVTTSRVHRSDRRSRTRRREANGVGSRGSRPLLAPVVRDAPGHPSGSCTRRRKPSGRVHQRERIGETAREARPTTNGAPVGPPSSRTGSSGAWIGEQ